MESAIHILRKISQLTRKKLQTLERIHYLTLAFLFFGLYIIWTTFKYTVLENQYYKGLADKQQTITVKNPVSRGAIYSNNEPAGVFATSTNLPDIAIDPQAPGDRKALIQFVTDLVYFEYCGRERNLSNPCLDGVLSYIREPREDNQTYTSELLKTKLKTVLASRIEKPYLDYVLLKENLTIDEIQNFEALNINGVFLVAGNAYVNPTLLTDTAFVSQKLQDILGMPKESVDYLISKRPVRYVKILKRMSLPTKDYVDVKLADEKEAVKKGFITEETGISNFIILEPNPTRFYPEKNLGGQLVGFVDNDGIGRYGIESYFQDYLQGQEGERQTRKDASGRTIGGYNLSEKKMVGGADIKLTIDRNIQKEVTRLLKQGVEEFRANKGSVVIRDPKNGAVVAMANYPDFDPNTFGDVYELEKVSYAKYPKPLFDLMGMPVFVEDSANGQEYTYLGKKILLRQATDSELGNVAIVKYKFKNNFGPGVYQNDAITGLYEPGSVFKAITTAVGIDTGDINPTDTYTDKGYVQIDKYTIKNVSKECIGRHTYAHALDWSCNVGMIDIAQKIGTSLFHKYIQDFGFGAKTNITLEGETYGRLPSYEKWSRTDLFTASFGQGLITATPLQMAAAYVAIANGGIYYEPYIVDSITFSDGHVAQNAPKPLRRVIKEETSKKVIAMLTEGATIGFAKKGGVDGYDVAGKTGTSQIATRGVYETGGAGHTITSYGGFAPASNPKFVMIVKIDRPRSAEYSESTSSALFSNIAKYLLNYYAIPKSR